MRPSRESLNSPLVGIAGGALAVTVVTAAIAVLDNFIPVLSLGVLYVFAVLPIALVWGTAYAVLVAVASMLAFNFFFLPPVYTFTLADRSNWFALLVLRRDGHRRRQSRLARTRGAGPTPSSESSSRRCSRTSPSSCCGARGSKTSSIASRSVLRRCSVCRPFGSTSAAP